MELQVIEVSPPTSPNVLLPPLTEEISVELAPQEPLTIPPPAHHLFEELHEVPIPKEYSQEQWEKIVKKCLMLFEKDVVTQKKSRLPILVVIFRQCLLFVLILTLIFGRPLWCWNSSCGDPNITLSFNFQPWNNLLILLLQLIPTLFIMSVRGYLIYDRKQRKGLLYIKYREIVLFFFCLFVVFDITLSLTSYKTREYPLTPVVLPFIITFSSYSVFTMMQYLFFTVSRASAIAITLLIWLLAWSSLGYTVFLDTPQEAIFSSYHETVLQMFICATTANYPDVTIPGYTHNRSTFLYFFPFLAFTLWVLLLLFVVITYDKFRDEINLKEEEIQKWKKSQAHKIFRLLDTELNSYLRASVVEDLFDVLRAKMYLHRLKKGPQRQLLQWLDRKGNGTLNSHEFAYLLRILGPLYIWQPPIGYSCFVWIDVKLWSKSLISGDVVGYQWARTILNYKYFERMMAILIGVSLFVIFAESAAYANYRNLYNETPFIILNAVFSFLFTVELSVRMLGYGFGEFWLDLMNRIEFCIILINFLLTFLELIGALERGVHFIILVYRITRLIRFGIRFESFVALILPFSHVSVATYVGVCLNILLMMSFFGMVGILLFGGVIRLDNPSLVGTDFANLNYYSLNFNDFPSALVLQFTILVRNNWHVIMNGVVAATHPSATIYFLILVVVGSFYFLTTLTSLVFDAYMKGKDAAIQIRKSEKIIELILGSKLPSTHSHRTTFLGLSDSEVEVQPTSETVEPQFQRIPLNMGLCSQCHEKLEEEWKFCPICGNRCDVYFVH
jgi:hypothetical protein